MKGKLKPRFYEAIQIVKFRLNDETIQDETKFEAIKVIARAETINSVYKEDLLNALRWIVDNYDIAEVAEGEHHED